MRTPRPHDFEPQSKRVIQPEAVDVADVVPLWESLKRLKMASMLTGELVSMSEMVREALDAFIEQKENPNEPDAPYG